MQPFIIVRPLDDASIPAYKRLIREYVMSFAFDAFVSCIFKEVRTTARSQYLCASHSTCIPLLVPISFALFIDIHLPCCSCDGCAVYFLRRTVGVLFVFCATCCRFSLRFRVQRLFCEIVRFDKCKRCIVVVVKVVLILPPTKSNIQKLFESCVHC